MFEEESGLDVELRSGKDLEFANQIVEEGTDSPADVFLTENSPAMSIVDNAGLFAELPESATPRSPSSTSLPTSTWTGFLARSTVAMYNTDTMTEADMPASILDFADPEWKGRVAFSPTGADFQAIVSAVLELEGEEATAAWLQGLKDNGVIVQNNLVVMQSVDSGEVDAGIAYHYYWYRDREENGTDSDSSALHFFGDQDPGAFLSVSGAGILASSEHQAAARGVRHLARPAPRRSRRWRSRTPWSTRSTPTPTSTPTSSRSTSSSRRTSTWPASTDRRSPT